jgi:hypothetical protein
VESEKALRGTGSGSQETILRTCTLRGKRMAGVHRFTATCTYPTVPPTFSPSRADGD